MTTRRYTESQVQAFVRDPDYDVLSIYARDRFGDHGIIGVLMLHAARGSARIDTFLLSCRVIGRGIEQAMVACAADLALAKGAARLVGEFIPTAKNAPAAGIYTRCGLTPVSETLYSADLQQVSFPYPEHTNVTTPDRAAQPARS
jgi:FkbH-like protein